MNKFITFPLLFVILVIGYFNPLILKNNLPIPSDTIIGLYYPYRDLFASEYPRGLPFKNFLITDPVRQQYPWKELAITLEKKLSFPLWNPYSFSGTPLLANFQTAAFYPLNILFLLFPFPIGWSFLIMLQPILAGIFLYLYLRNLNICKSACFLGSIVIAFSGFSTAWLEWGTIVSTSLWLPLILLSIDKLFYNFVNKNSSRKNVYIWCLLFIGSLVSSLFAGHLQTFIYVTFVSMAYFVLRWLQNKNSIKILWIFSLLTVCVLILSAIQWIPTLQFILQSARDVDQLNKWQQPGWFIPWINLIQFIVPDFFGNPTTLNYWGEWNYAEFTGYIGIVPLLMAIYAMLFIKDNKTIFFGVIFILSLIFALPTFFAKLPYFLNIPFLSSTQPTRLLFVTDFSLAVLAAFGFDMYFRDEKKKNIVLPLMFIGILFVLLWVFILIGKNYLGNITIENIAIAKRNLLLPSMIFIISSILIATYMLLKNYRKKFSRFSLMFFLIIITIGDLFRFSQKFNPFTDSTFLFPQTKSLSYLEKQKGQFRIMTTSSEILPPNFPIIYRLQSVDGYDPLYLRRYGELIAALEREKPDINTPFGFNRIITPHNFNSPLIDLLGVKYVLSSTKLTDKKFNKEFTEGSTIIYRNRDAFPRAFFVEKIIAVNDKKEAINELFDKNNNLRKTGIVENWNRNEKNFGKGEANIVEYNESNIFLSTKNQQDGFMVLMDTFYPTWHAEICTTDLKTCEQSTIYRTNYNFRGIVVPRGLHKIKFSISLI